MSDYVLSVNRALPLQLLGVGFLVLSLLLCTLQLLGLLSSIDPCKVHTMSGEGRLSPGITFAFHSYSISPLQGTQPCLNSFCSAARLDVLTALPHTRATFSSSRRRHPLLLIDDALAAGIVSSRAQDLRRSWRRSAAPPPAAARGALSPAAWRRPSWAASCAPATSRRRGCQGLDQVQCILLSQLKAGAVLSPRHVSTAWSRR